MQLSLINYIKISNPWLGNPAINIMEGVDFHERVQAAQLLNKEWDKLCTVLTGPRRAGKTVLGKYIAKSLLDSGRFESFLYLNCDVLEVREFLNDPTFIIELIREFSLKKPVIFIDEVQRITNPGLTLKAVLDLFLDIKIIASGSSQLEIRSKVEEYLTGRQFASCVLPFSVFELPNAYNFELSIVFGSYPQVIQSLEKELLLKELYATYINKDIIEVLRLGNPDIMEKLLSLLAHNSGQTIKISTYASDCRVSVTMINNYLAILEKTFVISLVRPFFMNKRSELTSEPKCYFLDNGFRNTSLRNFAYPENRSDKGYLIESFIYQEILKFKVQNFYSFDIKYWRTKSGAEMDFVIYKNQEEFIPVEVKFQNLSKPTVTRSFRSFVEAYKPKYGVIITKDYLGEAEVDGCKVRFMPYLMLKEFLLEIQRKLDL